MADRQRRVTLDDLLVAVGSLTDQIKTLVSAVDDLRCEVEWQARNTTPSHLPDTLVSTFPATISEDRTDDTQHRVSSEDDPVETKLQLLTAAGRLDAWERMLTQGARGIWLDAWSESDDFEMPTGRVIPVDRDTWSGVLDIRPAHVIGDSCCCEEGEAGPYLLAWRSETAYFLRELTDEEAEKLQELCLACQAEQIAAREETQPATQLGLF